MKKRSVLCLLCMFLFSVNWIYSQDPYIDGPDVVYQNKGGIYTAKNGTFYMTSTLPKPYGDISTTQVEVAFANAGTIEMVAAIKKSNGGVVRVTKTVQVLPNPFSLIATPAYVSLMPRYNVHPNINISSLWSEEIIVSTATPYVTLHQGYFTYDRNNAGKTVTLSAFYRSPTYISTGAAHTTVTLVTWPNISYSTGEIIIQYDHSQLNVNKFIINETYEIIDMNTGTIKKKGILTSFETRIDVSDLPSGIYVVRIPIGDQIVNHKIVIDK